MPRSIIKRYSHTINPFYFGGAVLFKEDGSYYMEINRDADSDECTEDEDGDLDCPTTELFAVILDQEVYEWINADLRKEVAHDSGTPRFLFKIKAEEKNMELLGDFFNALVAIDNEYLDNFTLIDDEITKEELHTRWEL